MLDDLRFGMEELGGRLLAVVGVKPAEPEVCEPVTPAIYDDRDDTLFEAGDGEDNRSLSCSYADIHGRPLFGYGSSFLAAPWCATAPAIDGLWADGYPSRWACAYCGSLHDDKTLRCTQCGASRSA